MTRPCGPSSPAWSGRADEDSLSPADDPPAAIRSRPTTPTVSPRPVAETRLRPRRLRPAPVRQPLRDPVRVAARRRIVRGGGRRGPRRRGGGGECVPGGGGETRPGRCRPPGAGCAVRSIAGAHRRPTRPSARPRRPMRRSAIPRPSRPLSRSQRRAAVQRQVARTRAEDRRPPTPSGRKTRTRRPPQGRRRGPQRRDLGL